MSKLFNKVLSVVIILFLIIFLTVSIFFGWYIYNSLLNEYKSKGSAIASSIASASAETILNLDSASLQAMIDQFLDIEGVSYVFVVDSTGEIISHTFVPTIPKEVNDLIHKNTNTIIEINIKGVGDFIDIVAPITEGAIGYVHVGMSKDNIYDKMRLALLNQIALLFVIFALSIIIAYVLVLNISRPLNEIKVYAEKLLAHDFSAKVNIKSDDEIGILSKTMQSMANNILEVFNKYEYALQDAVVELQDTLAYLNTIIDNIADGLIVVDKDGVINHINPAVCLMFDKKDYEMIGKNISTLGKELFNLVQDSLTTDHALYSDVTLSNNRLGKASAKKIEKEHFSEESEAKGILGTVILIRDITKEREIDRLRTEFVTTVSHELRTPLTSILGFVDMSKRKFNDTVVANLNLEDFKIKKAVNTINRNFDTILSEGERITSLVNQILDISKLESGNMKWNLSYVKIKDLIENAYRALFSLFDRKRIVFRIDIQQELPLVKVDKERILQVLVNLLSNALKFTDEGVIECKVEVVNDEMVISIEDEGIGIPEEEKENIFEKFKQVGDFATSKPTGTGLGLAISKKIVEFHGGRIWVDSVLGKGSKFIFTIPLKGVIRDNYEDIDS
ncbi:MAG: cell wall metabolism sensor histidine kinase WalK [Thermodesulfovibrionales bacterium]|nr:cell wall metabolism sensor histidine kinase WalK [Thermodesulfovibrionales bacterium]